MRLVHIEPIATTNLIAKAKLKCLGVDKEGVMRARSPYVPAMHRTSGSEFRLRSTLPRLGIPAPSEYSLRVHGHLDSQCAPAYAQDVSGLRLVAFHVSEYLRQ
jgi:hypothetical protein